jgi:hypothetical protein
MTSTLSAPELDLLFGSSASTQVAPPPYRELGARVDRDGPARSRFSIASSSSPRATVRADACSVPMERVQARAEPVTTWVIRDAAGQPLGMRVVSASATAAASTPDATCHACASAETDSASDPLFRPCKCGDRVWHRSCFKAARATWTTSVFDFASCADCSVAYRLRRVTRSCDGAVEQRVRLRILLLWVGIVVSFAAFVAVVAAAGYESDSSRNIPLLLRVLRAAAAGQAATADATATWRDELRAPGASVIGAYILLGALVASLFVLVAACTVLGLHRKRSSGRSGRSCCRQLHCAQCCTFSDWLLTNWCIGFCLPRTYRRDCAACLDGGDGGGDCGGDCGCGCRCGCDGGDLCAEDSGGTHGGSWWCWRHGGLCAAVLTFFFLVLVMLLSAVVLVVVGVVCAAQLHDAETYKLEMQELEANNHAVVLGIDEELQTGS